MPFLFLIAFSLATTSFGEFQAQMGNLLAVFLAMSQFLFIFSSSTIESRFITVTDFMILAGIFINLIQYSTMTYLSQSKTYGIGNYRQDVANED